MNQQEMQMGEQKRFFEFSQNNSGGIFDVDDNVAHYVIIEAYSPRQANSKAEEIGIYFDGCAKGMDCGCCGDRWHELYDTDEGDAELDMPSLGGMFNSQVIVYHLDGRKETFKED